MNIRLEQIYTRLESDVETPISHYIRTIGDGEGILFESAEVDGRWGRFSIIAGDFLFCARCVDGALDINIRDERMLPFKKLNGLPFTEGIRAILDALTIVPLLPKDAPSDIPPITRSLCGYFGYGMAGLFEPKLAALLPPEEAEACLVLPGSLTLFDHRYNRVCRLSLRERRDAAPVFCGESAMNPASIGAVKSSPDKEGYCAAVRTVQEYLRQGEGMQMVPSVAFSAPFEGDPFTLYRRLRRINPSPYLFYMNLPGLVLMGSSPEVMVGCEAGKVRISPIAGTRPRGETASEDNLFEEELVRDPKEQAEHVMLVDLARNDLGRIAVPGTVTLERYMEVERFSHVMHLTSYVTAQLRPDLDAMDVLAATFPAGTVSGAPKIRAMEIIAQVEPLPRGPYAGVIGWLGLDKDAVNLDTGITIRSLWIREGKVHWRAGAGVVLDSNPESEWKECANKAAVMLKALSGGTGNSAAQM